MKVRTLVVAVLAVALALPWAGPALAQGNSMFIPLLVYRTGAYAPSGIPIANGFVDYFAMINERDGGVNGVKIAWEECETQYDTKQGVECYERMKEKKPVLVNPYSTGITYALIDKAPTDKVPIFSMGYGMSAASDGRWFPYVFSAPTNYWSQASAVIRYIGTQEGGLEKLKGKKIVHVFHNSPYGKEANPTLEELAKKYGFELTLLAVDHPGQERGATWLQVRQQRPDYVFLWGRGVMNSTSIKEAIAVSDPRLQMYGVWWSSAEPDVTPAEMASKGYNGIALGHSDERDFPIHKDMLKHLYAKGQGTAKTKEEVGSVLYNRGMISAMLTVEAIKKAQEKFGKRVVTGEEVRWGAENLSLDAAKIKAMGFGDLVQPIKTSCKDHTGVHRGRVHTWDGKDWSYTSEWYTADYKVIQPLVDSSSKSYANEKKITPKCL